MAMGQRKMAVGRCLLVDTPTAVFQIFLLHMDSPDHASMRQVSRYICQQTTQHLPYITLRLTKNSRVDQLQQWFQATVRLHHVDSIHVYLFGTVSADVFEQVMVLLAQHLDKVTRLHLYGYDDDTADNNKVSSYSSSNKGPPIKTLQPLQHIIARLESLVVDGLTIQNLTSDLQQLATAAAAVGGWQLQSLTLNVGWSPATHVQWPVFPSTMKYLITAFPHLQQLTFEQPTLEYAFESKANAFERYEALLSAKQLAEVATVAVLANAVLQMKHLEFLEVTDITDIWGIPKAVFGGLPAVLTAATTAKSKGPATAAADGLNAFLKQGLLPSVSAAAAAFGTLDEYGCWLLQHHTTVKTLHISTATTGWKMSWQQQQQYQQQQASQQDKRPAAARLVDVNLDLKPTAMQQYIAQSMVHFAAGNNSSGQDSEDQPNRALLLRFTQQLSQYSFRPAAELMSHISSCKLGLIETDICGLSLLLGDLKSLKHLQVVMPQSPTVPHAASAFQARNTHASAALTSTVSAAATVQGLQCLILDFGKLKQLPVDLLLPLTAAAGGPGSSIKKLKLVGDFEAGSDTKNRLCGKSTCLRGLKQLDALSELYFLNSTTRAKKERSSLAVENLPASLRVLKGIGVTVMSAAAAGSKGDKLRLHTLSLDRCTLSSRSLMSNNQLRKLTVIESTWPGGWVAATWPNVSELVWRYDPDMVTVTSNLDNSDGALDAGSAAEKKATDRAAATIKFLLQQIFKNFRHLRSLTVEDIPKLSVDILQPVVQDQQQLRYIRFKSSRFAVEPPQPCTHSQPAQALRDWLQQRLPWATIHIVTA